MEKTIEYMRAAVLAECELLDFSTEGGFSYARARTPIEGIGIILMRGKYELSIYGSICQPIEGSDSITKLAYSVLGLDKRDALEAEKEKSKRWEFKDMLQQVLNHSNRPEMDDAQFRMFARENINHLLYGNKEGKKDE